MYNKYSIMTIMLAYVYAGFVQIYDGGCTVGAAVCCTSVRVSIETKKRPQLLCDHGPEADCASNSGSVARERVLFSVNSFFKRYNANHDFSFQIERNSSSNKTEGNKEC